MLTCMIALCTDKFGHCCIHSGCSRHDAILHLLTRKQNCSNCCRLQSPKLKKLACWLQLLSKYSYLSVLLRTFTLPWGNEAGMSHIGHLEPKSLWKSRFSEHSITHLTSNLFRTFASNHTFLSIPIRLALYFSLVKIFVTFYSQGEQQVVLVLRTYSPSGT